MTRMHFVLYVPRKIDDWSTFFLIRQSLQFSGLHLTFPREFLIRRGTTTMTFICYCNKLQRSFCYRVFVIACVGCSRCHWIAHCLVLRASGDLRASDQLDLAKEHKPEYTESWRWRSWIFFVHSPTPSPLVIPSRCQRGQRKRKVAFLPVSFEIISSSKMSSNFLFENGSLKYEI